MLKRLYFLFPEKRHIEHAVQELQDTGIKTGRMHTIAHDDVDVSGLPMRKNTPGIVGEIRNCILAPRRDE